MPAETSRALLRIVILVTCACAPNPVVGDGHVEPAGPDDPGGMPLVAYVDPFIGTAEGAPHFLTNAAGDTWPGAVVPFGMVQLGPDTTHAPSGYRWEHHTIRAFTMTHYSGRGAPCYQDVPILPTLLPITVSPGADSEHYAATFTHARESASPGYYGVHLDPGIDVELTATERTGALRVTFPADRSGTILFGAGGSANANHDDGTSIQIDPQTGRVTGSAESACGHRGFLYTVYFAADADRPAAARGAWSGDRLTVNGQRASGAGSGAYVTFAPSDGPVQLRVGLSYTSVENAVKNLEAESPGFDFDGTRQKANDAWESRLGSVVAEGGALSDKRVFYTALYHALIHPSVFGDVTGEYLGFDGRVHVASGWRPMHNVSAWDIARSQAPLLAMLFPDVASDMVASLLAAAREDPGHGMPRWLEANGDTGEMNGDAQDVLIASAYGFGARGFDPWEALAVMERGAELCDTKSHGAVERDGLDDYLARGYVTTSTENSGTLTLEYAQDDFALSRLAAAMGDEETRRRYAARSGNWRHLVDDGYLIPRQSDGHFASYDPTDDEGFVEGSELQYGWMVGQDMRGLFDAMGGDAAAIDRLDVHFTHLNAGTRGIYAFMGNEPELAAPYAYAFAGASAKMNALVRRILLEQYHATPGGMPGNDDGGALSSWVVLSMMGLYPAIPAVAGFVVGSPFFPGFTVTLGTGATLRIDAPAAARDAPYMRALRRNDVDHPRAWIDWSEVSSGARLAFDLDRTPSPTWGAAAEDRPPSFPPR